MLEPVDELIFPAHFQEGQHLIFQADTGMEPENVLIPGVPAELFVARQMQALGQFGFGLHRRTGAEGRPFIDSLLRKSGRRQQQGQNQQCFSHCST